MAFLFDTEEELETRKERRAAALGHAVGIDTEIALGTRSLLGIFFGLVLICAVFFGLGYSVGRGSGSRGAPLMESAAANPASDPHLSKPSPQQSLTPLQPTPADENQENPADTTPVAGSESPVRAAQPWVSLPPPPSVLKPVSVPPSAARTPVSAPASRPLPSVAAPATAPTVATAPQSFMVQVAAVRVAQDGDILVDALKKRGYTAVVRHEPQDQLLHIQLGPFTSRAEAMAMRSRLLSDGYNAVVK